MTVTVVVGAQWGDEAKGKLVDWLSEGAEIVARFNGGDNAGHTVVNPFGTFKLRLIPNGFSNPEAICAIGPGVVVNLGTLLDEIRSVQSSGIDLSGRLWVSPRCHLVLPYHPLLESIYERVKGQGRTGTTGRGMGPVYADKVSYNGIRLFDLEDEAVFSEKLRIQLALKNPVLQAFGLPPLDFETVRKEALERYGQARAYIREPFGRLQEGLESGANILLEGAQAALLDNIWGTYPYCTASNTLSGGAAAGLGIAPHWIERVIGVAKAYITRVGAGPMPTELFDEDGEALRREGQEYGTVTGRPRRCGWLDAELLKFSAQLNGYTELALTKLDVLDHLPSIKICVGYQRKGATSDDSFAPVHYWEGDAAWLDGCEPIYIELEGWMASTRGARDFEQLPPQAQAYVRKVEGLSGVPVGMVSVGPGREETLSVPKA